VERLVKRVIKSSDKPLLDTPETLDIILKEIFVMPSACMSILDAVMPLKESGIG
jgi:hypothetical protein